MKILGSKKTKGHKQERQHWLSQKGLRSPPTEPQWAEVTSDWAEMGWGHLWLSQNGLRSPPTEGGVLYKANFYNKYYLINHVNGEIQKLLCGIVNHFVCFKNKKHYFVFALVLSMQFFKESNKDWSTIESYTFGRIHCYTYISVSTQFPIMILTQLKCCHRYVLLYFDCIHLPFSDNWTDAIIK